MSEAAAEDPREEAAVRAFRVEQRLRMVTGIIPDEPVTGDWLILRGRRYAVVNSWKEVESKDGRARWGIVTDENIV